MSLAVIEGHAAREVDHDQSSISASVAVYCRVSSHEQKAKGDLARQVATTTRHCTRTGLGNPVVFTDVGSGLNATRPGLARLCKQVESGRVRTVVISFKDRLTRFGFEYLRRYFSSHGASIVVARQPATRSVQDELVEDLIAIITSFSGRVHGMRGTHGKRAATSTARVNPEAMAIARAISASIDATIDVVVHGIMSRPQISRSFPV